MFRHYYCPHVYLNLVGSHSLLLYVLFAARAPSRQEVRVWEPCQTSRFDEILTDELRCSLHLSPSAQNEAGELRFLAFSLPPTASGGGRFTATLSTGVISKEPSPAPAFRLSGLRVLSPWLAYPYVVFPPLRPRSFVLLDNPWPPGTPFKLCE